MYIKSGSKLLIKSKLHAEMIYLQCVIYLTYNSSEQCLFNYSYRLAAGFYGRVDLNCLNEPM